MPVAESSTSKPPPKWDPIVMFMSIIDELVELLSIDSWNVFFGYFESRQELLTGVGSKALLVSKSRTDASDHSIGSTTSGSSSAVFPETPQWSASDYIEVRLRSPVDHFCNIRRIS